MAAVGPESLYTNAAVERADAGRSRPSGRRSSCTAPRRSCARSIPSAGPCSAGGIRHRPRRMCRRAPYRDGWRRGSCRPLRGADRGVPRRSHSIVELGSSHSGKFGRPTMGSSGAIQINPKRSAKATRRPFSRASAQRSPSNSTDIGRSATSSLVAMACHAPASTTVSFVDPGVPCSCHDHNVRTRLCRGHFGDVKPGTRRRRVQRLFTPTVVGKRIRQAFAADGHRAWSSPHPRGVSDVDAARPICATRCDPAAGTPDSGTTTDS